MIERIEETAAFLSSKIPQLPRIGLITGTGLGGITAQMQTDLRLPYPDIPHFPRSTAIGHRGTLAFGKFGGQPVVAMEGRFHLYEGYTPQEVAFPIRVMAKLGVKVLLVSSAAGGLNPLFDQGDLMIVSDHINLTGNNPLVGPNMDPFGPRFPDMSEVYDRSLISLAKDKALKAGIPLKQGVYVGILGPSLETPAETRFLRMIGADAVGMSTVLEVIAGVHCGLRIMAIVAITNVNLPDCMKKASVEEIIRTAEEASLRLAVLWEKIAASLPL